MKGMDKKTCATCGLDCSGYYVENFNIKAKTSVVSCKECDRKKAIQEWRETGVLNTHLMMDAAIQGELANWSDLARNARLAKDDIPTYHRINKSVDLIQEEVKLFEREVWFRGLQQQVRRAWSGLSGEVGGCKVMALACAGRAMVTMEYKDTEITVITTDDDSTESRMGIQGLLGTEGQILGILRAVRGAWIKADAHHDLHNAKRPVLKPDRKVSIF